MLGTSSSVVYLTIREGKIAIKNGDKYTEHKNVTGLLTDVRIKEDGKFGPELHLSISGADSYQLQIKLDSGYGKSFLRAIPNADVTKPITFSPWYKVVDDKKKTALYLNQGGESVPWYFTKETPNGMPELVITKVKGKQVFDDFDQVEFLKKYLLNKVKPKLKKASPIPSVPVDDINPDDHPDLPF